MKKLLYILFGVAAMFAVMSFVHGNISTTDFVTGASMAMFPVAMTRQLQRESSMSVSTFTNNNDASPVMVAGMGKTIQLPGAPARDIRNAAGKPLPIQVPQIDHEAHTKAELDAQNIYPKIDNHTITITSDNGVGAVSTRIYLFNEDVLNSVTDNGSGANSIVITYQDGFGGKVVSRLLYNYRMGVGAICYGVALRISNADSTPNTGGLAASSPKFFTYTDQNDNIPLNFNASSSQTRKDFDKSIEVMPCRQNITLATQFSFIMPKDSSAVATFYFTPNFAI